MERVDVTRTFLPPSEEFQAYLEQIWQSSWLTNQGPLLQRFESEVSNYLSVKNFHFVSNGTIALQLALRALNVVKGEVITTPFSYVATTSAILWERCKPVFVDINPKTFCIDADKIEAAITKKTKAIMAVHVFGYPCEVEKIEAIAKKHKLKVIYDGAHAFGVIHKGKSLLSYGDASICSFHATKLFHTIEGGCVITKEDEHNNIVDLIKHFGHVGDTHHMLGINAKASEFQAAMGLCNLKYVDTIIAERRAATKLYDTLLKGRFHRVRLSEETKENHAYYPLLFDSEDQLHKAFEKLHKQQIFPRRYFYPSLNTLPYVDGTPCPVSEDISSRIACLPLFAGIKKETIEKIARAIKSV